MTKWWRTDEDGWPIEFFNGKPVYNFFRCIVQNLRKIINKCKKTII